MPEGKITPQRLEYLYRMAREAAGRPWKAQDLDIVAQNPGEAPEYLMMLEERTPEEVQTLAEYLVALQPTAALDLIEELLRLQNAEHDLAMKYAKRRAEERDLSPEERAAMLDEDDLEYISMGFRLKRENPGRYEHDFNKMYNDGARAALRFMIKEVSRLAGKDVFECVCEYLPEDEWVYDSMGIADPDSQMVIDPSCPYHEYA